MVLVCPAHSPCIIVYTLLCPPKEKGYVFTCVSLSVCLSVCMSLCLSVCLITQKVVNGIFGKFMESYAWPSDQSVRFWRRSVSRPGSKIISKKIYVADSTKSVLFNRWQHQFRRRFVLSQPFWFYYTQLIDDDDEKFQKNNN